MPGILQTLISGLFNTLSAKTLACELVFFFPFLFFNEFDDVIVVVDSIKDEICIINSLLNSFLKSGAALKTPKLGVLQSDDDNFTFSIKNLPATIKIAYAMPGMRYAQRANVTRINGVTSFTIPNPKRKSELLIYFNQKDALRFRIP